MKKIIFCAAAAAMVFSMASCQKTLLGGGSEVAATITVSAPAGLATKAIGDGQIAENLVFAVFDEEGNELPALRQGDWKNNIGVGNELKFDNSAKPSVTFTTTLAKGKEYTFVCWAQNKDVDYYDFSSMKTIGVSYKDASGKNHVAQDEKRDAFYAAVASGKIVDGYTLTITLRRPFAQINVGATDIQAATDAGLDVTNLYSTMTLTGIANKLNTFVGEKTGDNDGDGSVEGNETVTFELAPAVSKAYWDGTGAAADHEWLTVDKQGYENNVYGWLSMNYVLVNEATSQADFSIYEGETYKLTDYTKPNVPLKRNYRTHILGDLLTASGDITVIIEPDFYDEDIVY